MENLANHGTICRNAADDRGGMAKSLEPEQRRRGRTYFCSDAYKLGQEQYGIRLAGFVRTPR